MLQSLDVRLQALQFMGAGVQQLLIVAIGQKQLLKFLLHLMELQPGAFSFMAGLLHFVLAGLDRRQKLRQGISLRDGLLQAMAIAEVGLTTHQLHFQFQVVVGLQQLRVSVEQAQDHACHHGADRFGISDNDSEVVVRQPVLQREAA